MRSAPGRVLGLVAAILLAGVAVAVLLPPLELASGAETEIITLLKATERDGLRVPVPGLEIPLVSRRHYFDRITVRVDSTRVTATAVATLDFDGKLGDVEVSSLGLERVHWRYRDREWEPVEGFAPTLARVVGALEARRRALEAGNLARLGALQGGEGGQLLPARDEALRALLQVNPRKYRVRAWYIRAEREDVTVSEEYHLSGQLPDRPVDEVGRRRLTLRPGGREFFFSSGLM